MDSQNFAFGGGMLSCETVSGFLGCVLLIAMIALVGTITFNIYWYGKYAKEGMYIGASTNILRDDTGASSVDTLAETAAKNSRLSTDMGDAFTHRYAEHMTPEEMEQKKRRST